MTIGEFSRLVGVTPSALRYYDDWGLLVPAETDPRTGYRFYTLDQRRRAEVIRLLRDAGLALPAVVRSADHGSFTTVVMPRMERGPDGDPMEDADGSRQPGGAAVRAGDGG
jgi:DNA-binding transcriptional MerR regulator